MQHDKGKVSISKPIIISTEPSDDVIQSTIEDPNNTTISSPLIIDSARMESIVTPSILVISSNQEKQFIMFKETIDLDFLAYNHI